MGLNTDMWHRSMYEVDDKRTKIKTICESSVLVCPSKGRNMLPPLKNSQDWLLQLACKLHGFELMVDNNGHYHPHKRGLNLVIFVTIFH